MGQPFRTNSTHFTYHRLVVGDVLAVELQTSKGRPLDPPVRHNVTVVEGPVQCEEAAERLESCGPFIAVTSGTPNPGDYTMRLRVERFTLLEPGSGSETDLDTGHIVYTRNGVVCEEGCSGAAVGTDTVITFQDVQLKDRLAAELVRPDGSSLQPLVKTVVVVTRPAIRLISPAPQETAEDGEYEMEVHVTGFTLAAPGGIENAGTGHIRYLYKAEGARDFVPVPRSVSCEGSPATARTASTTFRLCDLSEGDQLAAELVDASGDPLDPPVRSGTLTVRRLPGEPFLIPAVGPEIAILLVGLAALRRKTET